MADDAGAEEAVARALVGLPAVWTVLHDVAWPGRRHADVDHVVVGPGGVFVIGSRGGRTAADQLAAGAGLDPRWVHPVLCVDGRRAPRQADDVIVCSPASVAEMLLSRPTVLAGERLSSARASVTTAVRRAGARRSVTARAARRRSRADGSLGRLGAFLLLVAATVAMVPHAAAQLEDRMTPPRAAVPVVGATVRLPGTASRPPVEVTAEPVAGRRGYVVRLTVRNGGDRVLILSAITATLTLDHLRHAEPVRDPSDGLAGVRLEPGNERSVVYRFAVPTGRAPTELTATVGGRSADRARWQVE